MVISVGRLFKIHGLISVTYKWYFGNWCLDGDFGKIVIQCGDFHGI